MLWRKLRAQTFLPNGTYVGYNFTGRLSDLGLIRPSLVPDLIAIVQTQIQVFLSNPTGADPANTHHLKRTLRVLYLVVKEFCSIRMPSGIKTMTQMAESLYSPLVSYYDRLSSLLRASFTTEALLNPHLQSTCEDVITLCHLVFKPCTRIMLWLWQKAGQPQYSAALETVSLMFFPGYPELNVTHEAGSILRIMLPSCSESL
jgi:hypothetical protein